MKRNEFGMLLWEVKILPLERRFWHLVDTVQHPRRHWNDWKHWRQRPKIGDLVVDCREKTLKVVSFGRTEDDLILEDGSSASWMNCCERPAS
jgi:hypothetical protein